MRFCCETILRKMDGLAVWPVFMPMRWALKQHGVAVPYFCCVQPYRLGDVEGIDLLLLEGWQSFHDYIRLQIDPCFGSCMYDTELSHFRFTIANQGDLAVTRYDPGYFPVKVTSREMRKALAKLLWEVYGVMMRVEVDQSLPLRYANERALFARVEDAKGVWHDEPLEIPPPRPCVERVTYAKDILGKVKDLPLAANEVLDMDLRVYPCAGTEERRSRNIYLLVGVDDTSAVVRFEDVVLAPPDGSLNRMWEFMADLFLRELLKYGRVPAEVRVRSPRMFRFLRPLCVELPIKLTLHTERMLSLEIGFATFTHVQIFDLVRELTQKS